MSKLKELPVAQGATAAACCTPLAEQVLPADKAHDLAPAFKALGDPVRLQLVDVLRKHAGKVCVCDLVPLFDLSQPTISHHLKVLRQAGIVGSERVGLWAYYYVIPDTLKELSGWLS
jgi:ArsR family transcriptional regulator